MQESSEHLLLKPQNGKYIPTMEQVPSKPMITAEVKCGSQNPIKVELWFETKAS